MKSLNLFLFILLINASKTICQGIFKASENSLVQTQVNDTPKDEKPSQTLNAFNFDSNAKSIDYSFLQPLNKRLWLGFGIEGRSNSSITKIFENGNFVPSTKLSTNIIYSIPFKDTPFRKTDNKIIILEKQLRIAIDQIDLMIDEFLKTNEKALDGISDPEKKIEKLVASNFKKIELNKLIKTKKKLEKQIRENVTYTYNGMRLGFNASFEGRGFYNYIQKTTFQNELVERRKNILNFSTFINYYTLNLEKCGPYIGGLSIGYSETDNFSRLAEVSVINTWKSEDGNGTSRSTTQKLTAFEGNYIDTIRQFKFGLDQYFVPEFLNRKIGISFNYTYNHIPNGAIKDHQDITVGVYFIKDSPFAPLQGIIFSFKDIRKQLEIPESQSRFSIGYTRQLNMYRVLRSSTSDDKPNK